MSKFSRWVPVPRWVPVSFVAFLLFFLFFLGLVFCSCGTRNVAAGAGAGSGDTGMGDEYRNTAPKHVEWN